MQLKLGKITLVAACQFATFVTPGALASAAPDSSVKPSTTADSVAGKPDEAPRSTSETPANAPAQSNTPMLKTGIRKLTLSLERLRDLGIDLKHVHSAAEQLLDEVTIQPVTLTEAYDVSLPGNGVLNPVGPATQPQKRRVDVAMNEMKPVIKLLKKNADDFRSGQAEIDLSADVKAELAPTVDKWLTAVKRLADTFQLLRKATVGPQYNNAVIAGLCTQLQGQTKDLDKVRREVYKIIRRQGESLSD